MEKYMLLLDLIHSSKKNFPGDLKPELCKKMLEVRPLVLQFKKEKCQDLFEQVFKKIAVNNNKSYQDCICDILIEIFHRDYTTLTNWYRIYTKNLPSSAIILQYIGKCHYN